MRLLIALSSTAQLYSGIGRSIFELSARLVDRVAFEFAIDDAVDRNVRLLRDFCAEYAIPLHVGQHRRDPDAADFSNTALPEVLSSSSWDAVECVSWASAATHRTVLEELNETLLVYTPHYQPSTSIPIDAKQRQNIEATHHEMLERADVVFCDSPYEQRAFASDKNTRADKYVYLPQGCNFSKFTAGSLARRPQLVFVGDYAEPRKRFDRALAVFGGVKTQHPELRLLVIGNRSAEAAALIPESLRTHVELRGYVGDQELRQTYTESLGLILLSDYEAFGIPILEALASGTPAFIADTEVLRSLFGGLRGVHFCSADDEEAAITIDHVLRGGLNAVIDALRERPHLKNTFDWDLLAEWRWNALASAWVFKHRFLPSATR